MGNFPEEKNFAVSVDGVHFTIIEVRTDPGKMWFDFKSNSAALKYKFALALDSKRLCWIRGNEDPASISDITFFCGGKPKKKHTWDKNSLYHHNPPGKKAIGEPDKFGTTQSRHSPEVKQFFVQVKSRQEAFHTRLKSFNALKYGFRHDKKYHCMCVEAAAVMIQYDMENGHPLFAMKYR
ncbi:hypothetical protein ACHAXS_004721 [Conticribra weissflogii]